MAYLNNFTLSTFVPLIKEHFQRQVAHYIRYGTQDCDWRNQHAVCVCAYAPTLLHWTLYKK